MELRLKYPPTPEHAEDLARVCVETAKRVSAMDLDYSPSSLVIVDRQLEKFRQDNLGSADIASTLFCFGCYVGEVLLRSLGGHWVRLEQSALSQHGGPPIVVHLDNGSTWNPIGKVFKRVDDGEGDSLPYFYRVVSAQATRGSKHGS